MPYPDFGGNEEFHFQLVVQLCGKVMQNITFDRMKGLEKLWHLCKCGDSQFPNLSTWLLLIAQTTTSSREIGRG